MIEEFILKFTYNKIEGIKKIRNSYYLISKEIQQLIDKISYEPEYAGVFLGEIKKKNFQPSVALIEILSGLSDKKMFLDSHASWLYLCGRDAMAKSIIKSNVNRGLVLVQDERDNNLGYGQIMGKLLPKTDKIVVKNILDKGDFIRREMR